MNEAMEVVAKVAALPWQQAASQQIQIRQREGGIQPRGILRQPTVANFAKAPQALDHVEGVLDRVYGVGGR
jgi:hypothetical protein